LINEERLVNDFMSLVQVDSPSLEERKMADILTARLHELGLAVREDRAGREHGSKTGNLITTLKGEGEPLLLCAHMDRVVPGKGIKPVLEDGVIRSKGDTILAADDIAGVVAILETIRHLQEEELKHRPLEVVFTIAEEVGLLGSKALKTDQLKAKLALVLDSTGPVGTLVYGAPSQNGIRIKFTGKAAHAGVEPEKGISAIQIAARAIDRMPLGRIDQETTANVGIVRGGEAVNIVTPEVEIKGECRSHDDEKLGRQTNAMLTAAHRAAADFGGGIEMEVECLYTCFKLTPEDEVMRLVTGAAARIGIEANMVISGGGSDANILNQKGIQTVNLGIGCENAHTTEEYEKVDQLVNLAKLVAEVALS